MDPAEFEEAIQTAVATTSKGNPEEDKVIEKAIRASVTELQAAEKEGDDKDAIQRAIRASIAEAARARAKRDQQASSSHTANVPSPGKLDPSSAEDPTVHDEELELSLHRSVTTEAQHPLHGVDFDDSGIDTDDENDKDMKAAIQLSKSHSETKTGNDKDAKDLEEAIRLSEQSYQADQAQLEKKKTEEEIVLEYVRKASLEESKYKEGQVSRQRSAADEAGGSSSTS